MLQRNARIAAQSPEWVESGCWAIVHRWFCVAHVFGPERQAKGERQVMSRFTSTSADCIYMAIETVLDQYRRDGISEEQIRAILDRAINASSQLEATRALIKHSRA